MHHPLIKFSAWLAEADAHPAIGDATAMTLATATAEGAPSARIVLLKGHDAHGFLFYTNLTSRKSNELEINPRAALCFYWEALNRQVRIEGVIAQATPAEADAYFASRPRERQIGAWASLQSQPLESREMLDARYCEFAKKFEGSPVPRPPHWSGWRLTPLRMEFWINSDARLHEREIYTRTSANDAWTHGMLYP